MAPGTISHYRIIRRLGRGGMGEVFLAEDTRLGRRLALKLLLAEFTRDPSRLLRFEREARAASSLNHPNILTVYEIGESEGRHFIATEFVDGETLRHKIKRAPLAPAEAARIACQMAEALAAAHEAGVVHRDVKPENVMVRRDGYVKVLDFGLAKLVEQRRETGSVEEAATVQMARTSPGAVMGTVWYMSPEQARGEVVDERTDVWALGCVLYEMLAGLPPFTGETASHVTVSILEKEPPSITQSLGDAPPELERVLSKALSKDRAARYPTAAEMLEDLRALASSPGVLAASAAPRPARPVNGAKHTFARGTGDTLDEATGTQATPPSRRTGSRTRLETAAPALMRPGTRALIAAVLGATLLLGGFVLYKRRWAAPRIDAVAVLPFANVGGSPDTEWLSDGITESLINSLSPAAGLKVMSRNSVFRYKGRDIEPGQVGRELGVGAVLAGQVAQRGEDLTVSVELIDVRDNTHIWGDKYERKLSDALKVQEEIARQIASRLRSRLGGEAGGGKHYTESGEAYQDYLRGRYFWNKRTEEGFRKAVQFFDRAIERDPRYALAYAGLADTYALMSDYSIVPPREAMPKARAAAEEALAIDDALAEAHTSRAFVRMAYEWKWAEAEQDFRRALELNPNYATAHQWYAILLIALGRPEEALREMRRAWELDPLSAPINHNLGWALYSARDYADALEQLRKTLELEPDYYPAQSTLGVAYALTGSYQEALAAAERAVALAPDNLWILPDAAYVYARAGARVKAREVLQRLEERSHAEPVPFRIALVYTALGEKDAALQWLERVPWWDLSSLAILAVDPRMDPIRSDPRYLRMLKRLGLGP